MALDDLARVEAALQPGKIRERKAANAKRETPSAAGWVESSPPALSATFHWVHHKPPRFWSDTTFCEATLNKAGNEHQLSAESRAETYAYLAALTDLAPPPPGLGIDRSPSPIWHNGNKQA